MAKKKKEKELSSGWGFVIDADGNISKTWHYFVMKKRNTWISLCGRWHKVTIEELSPTKSNVQDNCHFCMKKLIEMTIAERHIKSEP
jgi:hypothetical protein